MLYAIVVYLTTLNSWSCWGPTIAMKMDGESQGQKTGPVMLMGDRHSLTGC